MNNYECLDLDIIKKEIIEYASIDEAKQYILDETVDFNPLIIKNKALETSEALCLIDKQVNIQFSGITNVNDIFHKADKNITLSGIELKDTLVFHNHCKRIKNEFDKLDCQLQIKDYTDSITINDEVFRKIEKTVDNSGEIKDDASSQLSSINKQISTLDQHIYSKAQQFLSKHSQSLQEASIYVRENRITFLIKNSDKNKYGGYTYGSSASGLASYIEPSTFIDDNNKMIELLHDKQDEITRILNELTYLLSTVSENYYHNFDSLVKLNVIFSKANYGYKRNGIIPKFIDSYQFSFNDLCHPLIDSKKVVSNSYRLFDNYRGLVISGSNTGGKTVSLKAIGLSVIMSYLGIPIIASSGNVPLYRNVFVDIDDNQSIQNSLSTFSAHIKNINDILNNANKSCLILIDELISGTDPKQAQAISLAILDRIKQIGSVFVITTHFDDVKNYSYSDENILLSSVGFNTDTLMPTYKYIENSIGSSNALEIASRYFDDQRIIENAKMYIKKNESKQDELLDQLSIAINDVEKQKDEIKIKENNLENLNNELRNRINEIEKNKNEILSEYKTNLKMELDKIKQKAIDKLNSIHETKSNSVIKKIDELIENDNQTEKVEFNVGDNVRIKDNEQVGTITEIRDQKVNIDVRGISVKTSIDDLILMPKIVKKKQYQERPRCRNVSKELNLVGQRVEDGLIMLEEYLDSANAANLSSVKIIHGIGTGALRIAIRERLKKISYIKSFKDGDFYDGGSAVTIVEFK